MTNPDFAVTGATVFDGVDVRPEATVLVRNGKVAAVGGAVPEGVPVVDGRGKTLIPGLIDTHTHVKPPVLETSLAFGVTTEFDMLAYPEWMVDYRAEAQRRNDMADVRSALYAATVEGGHPTAMVGSYFPHAFPVIRGVEDVPDFVAARVAEGSDYIKLMIDDGTTGGHPLNTLTPAMSDAVVREAHRHGVMAVAHAIDENGILQALRSGVDGLVHVHRNVPPHPATIDAIASSGVFVVPTMVMNGDLTIQMNSAELLDARRLPDGRFDIVTEGLLSGAEHENACGCWPAADATYWENSRQITRALYEAGVDLLAGTDVVGVPLYGSAHGLGLHQELWLMVEEVGMSPLDVLRGATWKAAHRFGLDDRGRIAPGLQADLVLIDGDPLTSIRDSLSIDAIWRRGERFDREAYRATVRRRDAEAAQEKAAPTDHAAAAEHAHA